MIVTTLLGIGFIFALAAVFVLWAKLDEQRKATAEEYNRRWDEVSRSVNLEKELEQRKAREYCSAQAVLWYAEQLAEAKLESDEWQQEAKRNYFFFDNARKGNKVLQDKLSALLCPHNDHVWQDGCCVKCGRMKDAND